MEAFLFYRFSPIFASMHLPPAAAPRQNRTMNEPEKTAISTSGAPSAIGPYSQAVRIGNFLYTSGQIALDPATGQLTPGGIVEQTTQVIQNLKAVLAAAGTGVAHILKTTVFLKDMGDFAAMNGIYGDMLAPAGSVPPARSTVEVARLPKDALVEIEVIAAIPEPERSGGRTHPAEAEAQTRTAAKPSRRSK